jgi:isopentenyl-diphosphate delta-isomerase
MTPDKDEELVVLLTEDGAKIGAEAKRSVHRADTPLHLAFSCYIFDRRGRFLMTRRALDKVTFPGLWTNSCCGHPAPGESVAAAARRRSVAELGIEILPPEIALPGFRYTANMNGIVENEICPVLLARTDGQPDVDPSEVCDTDWIAWSEFVDRAAHDPSISPWAKLQTAELETGGYVEEFLSTVPIPPAHPQHQEADDPTCGS